MTTKQKFACALVCVLAGTLVSDARATIPYGSAGGPFPGFGPVPSPPPIVGGKEYSHDLDHMITAVGTAPDPEQVVAWDGSGGVVDATDFSGTRPLYLHDDEIDAIANRRDFAYNQLKADFTHLVFSVDDVFAGYSFGMLTGPLLVPPGAPGVTLGNGNVIGGSGELSVELALFGGANAPDTQILWAPQAAINGMPLPDDIDGVELWGPEPPQADTDKYSLDVDIASFTPPTIGGGPIPGDAVSVWNGAGTPYVPHSAVVFAVASLLGADSLGEVPEELINIDALMVHEIINTQPDGFDEFEPDPTGAPGDEIIFSIRQIPDPGDMDGYYATGSELFFLNANGAVGFLAHGGHLWDHAYSLTAFEVLGGRGPQDPNYGVIDINAIEAIGQFAVPEPSTFALLALCGLFAVTWRRTR